MARGLEAACHDFFFSISSELLGFNCERHAM